MHTHTHLGLGFALSAVTAEVVGVSEPLNPIFCWVEQVYIAGEDLHTHKHIQ